MTFTQQKPVHSIIVPGGGSAGFVAAPTLKRRFLELPVRVIRSGYIGLEKK